VHCNHLPESVTQSVGEATARGGGEIEVESTNSCCIINCLILSSSSLIRLGAHWRGTQFNILCIFLYISLTRNSIQVRIIQRSLKTVIIQQVFKYLKALQRHAKIHRGMQRKERHSETCREMKDTQRGVENHNTSKDHQRLPESFGWVSLMHNFSRWDILF
jgi:hypothetical protein